MTGEMPQRCQCKHDPSDHDPEEPARPCLVVGCGCGGFEPEEGGYGRDGNSSNPDAD